jgi:hypothetical protein
VGSTVRDFVDRVFGEVDRGVRGPDVLADAAITAMRPWKFEPPVGPDKKPSDVTATITMRFALD